MIEKPGGQDFRYAKLLTGIDEALDRVDRRRRFWRRMLRVAWALYWLTLLPLAVCLLRLLALALFGR